MTDELKILFLGDITGRPGRVIVKDYLAGHIQDYDFVIANVENASHGFGLTAKNHEFLKEIGIGCFTSGNHIWDKKDVFDYIGTSDRLVRPLNYPEGTPGEGYKVFDVKGHKVAVMNLLGRTFMNPADSPWALLEKQIGEIKSLAPTVLVDFHAEATAEKICFGIYSAQRGVSAVIGTHTHIQTADEKIIDNYCAYITDAGFCGDNNGVIGMDYGTSLKRFTTLLPERFEVADSGVSVLNGVELLFDPISGAAKSIKRINFVRDYNEEKESES